MVSFHNKYIEDSKSLRQVNESNFKGLVKWRSPSNIALIKYWGKRDFQVPQNPSLSFTLNKSYTETEVEYKPNKGLDISLDFFFDGKENSDFKKRIRKNLESITGYLPFLQNLHLTIKSRNSFPHSSGIASSASAMSALALCLCSIEQDLFGTLKSKNEFFEKSSFLARIGSGSASRSVYGDFVIWGHHKEVENSSDEIGIPLGFEVHPSLQNLNDSILIVSKEPKKVSSSLGHNLMNYHPYAKARYKQARTNLQALIAALKSGDEQSFLRIVENEALSLHALMLSSDPGFTLLDKKSLEVMDRIRNFRETSGKTVCFTLDAGPNVHVIYPEKYTHQVNEFIKSDLLELCEDKTWIDDKIGKGPFKSND